MLYAEACASPLGDPPAHDYPADQTGSWRDRNCSLWAAIHWSTPESIAEKQPVRHAPTGVVVVADCRLDNREELLSLLSDSQPESGDCSLIAAAWLRWGESCIEHLLGDFAFAIWDPRCRSLFCARDSSGCRPFYFSEIGDGIVAASDPGILVRHPSVSKELDPEWLNGQLSGVANERAGIPYRNVRRLPPGHTLLFRNNRLQIREYWRARAGSLRGANSTNAIIEEGRHLLSQAVACRLRSAWPIGAELTAGLDSSGVVATAAPLLRARGDEITVFSRVRSPEYAFIGPDEASGIELLCQHLGIQRRFTSHGTAPGLLEFLDNAVMRHAMPLAALPLTSEETRIQARSVNIRTVLSGQGGDECFSTSESRLPLERGSGSWRWRWTHYRALARRTNQNRARQAATALAYATCPEFARWRRQALLSGQSHQAGNTIANRELALSRRLEEYREASPLPTPGASRVEVLRNSGYLFRMESSALLARRYKQVWAYPLLDRRLIEFTLACPPEVRTAQGWTRRLARLVIEDRVPREIAWQRSKLQAVIPGSREFFLEHADLVRARLHRLRQHPLLSRLLDFDGAVEALDRPGADAIETWIPRVSSVLELLQFANFVLLPQFGDNPAQLAAFAAPQSDRLEARTPPQNQRWAAGKVSEVPKKSPCSGGDISGQGD